MPKHLSQENLYTSASPHSSGTVSSLKSTGRFSESFDYTLNNFQKTSITGKKVGNKYVLGLCAAYVGSEPENALAETLGEPLALLRSSINGKLSIVDDWWFNLRPSNTEALLRLNIETANQKMMDEKLKEISDLIDTK